MTMNPKVEGILPIYKQSGVSSFSLVRLLRKLTNIKKIGHAGTLDPFAEGVMILLIGKNYTKQSDQFLKTDKEYLAKVCFGIETDSYDLDGQVVATSSYQPTIEEVKNVLEKLQGNIEQTPPMFSAKKVNGKKLYELARKGKTIERLPITVTLKTELIFYEYPFLTLKITCSKGTYIRSIAQDLGKILGCKGHLFNLIRTRSGHYRVEDCIKQEDLSLKSALAHVRKELLFGCR